MGICSKVSYPSREAARKDAEHIYKSSRTRKKNQKVAKQTGKEAKKLRPYNCPRCRMWHLTSQKKRKW